MPAATATRRRSDPVPDSVSLYLESVGRHDLLTADDEIELAQRIEAGDEARSRLDAGDHEGPAEAARLRRDAIAGDRAREQFIAANLRLVVANARKYRGAAGLEMGDLIQEGNLGLIRAVEKFDWRKGFKFSTYATWWIRQALSRAIAEKSRVMRIPIHLHDMIGTVKGARSQLKGRLGRDPRPEEIAEETGIDLSDVERVLAVTDEVSIEQPIGEDGAQLGDFILDEDAVDVSRIAEEADVARMLKSAMRSLDEREMTIIVGRYGFLDDGIPRTLEEIGDDFGLTPERIRQIEKRALSKLRHPALGLREEDMI
ncbi:MAG: sigma-70 family RNA polymerase sigma factor [Acidimicrobiia bacterium]|nr:sigma-70 family RNA polymerase sigma factor [Acidimicrobiia bacterium]